MTRSIKKKTREKGKIKLSEYFKELNKGDRVAVTRESSVKAGFPQRIQGDTGVIEGIRGKAYIVKIKDNNKEKRFIINAIHLKKLK
ncbi:MAG: 50S ribosomal protein L21e [archaeon]